MACSTCGGSVVGMRRASSGEVSSCLKAGGKGKERGLCSRSSSIVEEEFLGVVEVIPSDVVVSWLAGKVTDEDGAVGSEASFFLVGAGEKASPPPSTATRIPETGGAEIFGSLGALAGRSGDLGSVFLFLLTIVRQRGGAKTTEKLSAKGDDSGKRKRRDVVWLWHDVSNKVTYRADRSTTEPATLTTVTCGMLPLGSRSLVAQLPSPLILRAPRIPFC